MACRIRTNRQRRVDLVTSCSLAFSNIRRLGCLLEMREGETCFLSFFEFFFFCQRLSHFMPITPFQRLMVAVHNVMVERTILNVLIPKTLCETLSVLKITGPNT